MNFWVRSALLTTLWVTMGCRGQARAAAPTSRTFLPRVGDVMTYAVSDGDRVVAKVVGVHQKGDRTYADIQQVVTHRNGQSSRSHFRLVRTDDEVALDMPVEGDNGQLSPLVYFLAIATPHDTWVAQQGAFQGNDGSTIHYQLMAKLMGIETVRVIGGVFPGCYRIDYRVAAGESQGDTRMTLWFKPDLGIVETRTVDQTGTTETQLTSCKVQGVPNQP